MTAPEAAALSALVGFDVPDDELVATALRPSRRGFSRLEFVGDAVLGLAVATTLHRRGDPVGYLSELVSNERLDEIYRAGDLSRLAPRCSGDVIEALIGAIHLTAGFDAGAAAALALVVPDATWTPPVGPAPDPTASSPVPIPATGELRHLAFVGAATIGCAAAHHAVTTLPTAPHRVLARHRVRLVSPSRVLGLPSVHIAVPTSVGVGEERGYDCVQAATASVFLASGWPASLPWITDVLAFGSVPSPLGPKRRRTGRRFDETTTSDARP